MHCKENFKLKLKLASTLPKGKYVLRVKKKKMFMAVAIEKRK